MTDPKSAIDAVLQGETEISGIKIYPITLARYALLELVKSPLVTPGVDFTSLSMIPTIFIMSQDRKYLLKYNSRNIEELEAEAMNFAEDIDIFSMNKIVEELQNAMAITLKVAPQIPEDANVKKKENPVQTE